jgi:hypothetical protein
MIYDFQTFSPLSSLGLSAFGSVWNDERGENEGRKERESKERRKGIDGLHE